MKNLSNFFYILKKGFYYPIINTLFPNSCWECDITLTGDDVALCMDCLSRIPRIADQKHCSMCCSLDYIDSSGLCQSCIRGEAYFDCNSSCFPYDGTIQRMIQAGKFENRRSVWKLLAREMAILFQKIHLEEGRVLIPLPISKKRRRERGFNQSAIIAKHLSRQFQIPCYENILHKTKHNTAQFSLSLGERKKNPVGCYEVQNRELIKEKTIILIDDVFTTGSTVNECAKVLKGGGAFRVIALTVARVGLKSNE